MQITTAKKLIKLNNVFYQTIGKYFDSSRNYFWPGWIELGKYLKKISNTKNNELVTILDLGCGNGRFSEFLVRDKILEDFSYEGIDYSEYLIDKAKKRLKELKVSKFNVLNKDLLFDNWKKDLMNQKYDVVLLFGVMHHIPSKELRIKMLENIKNLLSPEGIAVITFWKFKDIPRLQRRTLRPEAKEYKDVLKEFGIQETEMEKGDHILDWERGRKAYRYCHYYSTEEAKKILTDNGFKILETYRADGREEIVNEYFICKI